MFLSRTAIAIELKLCISIYDKDHIFGFQLKMNNVTISEKENVKVSAPLMFIWNVASPVTTSK